MLRHSCAKYLTLCCLTLSLSSGCFLFGGSGNTTPTNSSAQKSDGTSSDKDTAPGEDPDQADKSGSTEPASPTKLTQAEVEEQMAPPDGLLDVRPILGTDPSQPLPAIFAKLKKGMTIKELNTVFVGVARYKVGVSLTTANGGKTLYRVMGVQPHNEIVDTSLDDDKNLESITYMFDKKKIAQPEFWTYFKKAAGLKWGKPPMGGLGEDSGYAAWKPEGLKEIVISGENGEDVSISVKF